MSNTDFNALAESTLADPALLRPSPTQSDAGFDNLQNSVHKEMAQARAPASTQPVTGGQIQILRNGGYSEDEINSWADQKAKTLSAAGFSTDEIHMYLTGNKTPPIKLPLPFLRRFNAKAGWRVLDSIAKGAETSMGSATTLGIDPGGETEKSLQSIGIFNKPGEANPVRLLNEAIMRPAAMLGDMLMREIGAGVTIPATVGAQLTVEATAPEPGSRSAEQEAQKGAAELTELGNVAALLSGTAPGWSRVKQDPLTGRLVDEHFSGPPKASDFGDAARTMGGPTAPVGIQEKLLKLYEDKGLHPSEVFSDALGDVTIKQKLLSSSEELPYQTAAQAMEAELPGGGSSKPPIEGEIIPPTSGEGPRKIEAAETIEAPAEGSLEAARESIRSKLSVGEASPRKKWGLSHIYESLIDNLFGLQQTEKRAVGGDLIEEVADSPTKLARLFAGVADKAQQFLERGPVEFATLRPVGKGLKQILEDVVGEGDLGPLARIGLTGERAAQRSQKLMEFRDFITATRALELESRGIKSGFDAAAAEKVVGAAAKEQKAAFMELNVYQDNVLRYLRDSGVISKSGYVAMKEQNRLYVPFYRLFEDSSDLGGSGKSYIPYNPVKRIKGSARDVVDPLESIIRNTFAFVNLADRNVISTKLVDLLLKADEAMPAGAKFKRAVETAPEELSGAVKGLVGHNGGPDLAEEVAKEWADIANFEARGKVAIFRDGKKESYHIDPDLAAALKGLNADSMGFITQVLNVPASILRAGAVLTPEFALKFLIRDYFTAMATYPGVFTPLDTVKGLIGMVMRDGDFSDWLTSGGGGGFASFDRRYLQSSLDKLAGETGLTTRAWNVMLDPESSIARKLRVGSAYLSGASAANKYLINPLRGLTEIALSANRLGAFKKSMRDLERKGDVTKEGMLKAAWTSRETSVDPNRIGANMRAFNMISAFANATIADPVRMVRALKDNPVQSSVIALGAITLPSVLLWFVNHNDSRIKELPEWRRDMFWNFAIDKWEEATLDQTAGRPDDQVRFENGKYYLNNGAVWSMPKPWGWGLLFGTFPERLLDQYYAKNPHAFDGFASTLWNSSVPSVMPTAAVPFYEQFANKSLFNGQTIIPSYLEKQLPEYEYTPYSTELTKRIGAILGAFPGMRDAAMRDSPVAGMAHALTSPALMENYIQAWTGSLGNYALQLADYGLRKSGKIPDPIKPSWTLADVPFVRAFAVRYPSAQAQSVQLFYSEFDRVDKYYQTWRARLQAGDAEGADRIAQAGGNQMFVRLTGTREALGKQSTFIRWINDNPDIPADEKRQIIDSAYYGMIQIAQTGNAIMEQIK